MVNPGHPSRGCHECRRKKVKCDEGQPECFRCLKSGKPCPGYRPLTDTTFKVSVVTRKKPTPSTAPFGTHAVLQERIAEALFSSEFQVPSGDHSQLVLSRQTKSASGSPERQSPPLNYSPSVPWENVALPLFFNMFTYSSPSRPGLLSFLPQMYAQSGPQSCLGLAIAAAVDANAVRKLADTGVMHQARGKHIVALSAVKDAILDPRTATQDATLCSLYILTLFEYISGDTVISHGSHIDGYEALLTLRSKVLSRENHVLYLDIIGQVLVKHLRMGTVPSPALTAVIEGHLHNDPRSFLTSISLRACQFNQTALQYINAQGTETDLLWVLTTGQQLDAQFSGWPYTDEPEWACTTFDTPLANWTGPFHVYGNLICAIVWNMYRCARIALLLNLLQCGKILLSSQDPPAQVYPSVLNIKSKIMALLSGIVASYPYIIGRGDSKWEFPTSGVAVGAYTLVWPTGVVLRCSLATPEQKAITIATMDYIGKALGIQRSLTIKDAWVASQKQVR